MRCLIIEDDPDTLDHLKNRLEEKCFAVDTATDGVDGLYFANTNEYDIILLDYALPLKNGFEVCTELRKSGNHTPIIMLSATAELIHKIEGFHIGMDDYVTKPFFFDEVYARIQAVLRRPRTREQPVLTIDDLILDTARQKVTRGDEAIYLTRKEFSLLEYLMKHAGTVVSRGTIMEHIWDVTLDPFSNTIETHILNLRKKVDQSPYRKLIHSIPGRGYKIDIEK